VIGRDCPQIAVNQDVTPQGMPVVAGDSSVWARKLTGGAVAVALYNEDDAPKSIGVSFAKLGWSATTKATVRDLWAHKDLAPATGMLKNMTVAAHGSYLLLLTESK
jgi:alpha-galactosidase